MSDNKTYSLVMLMVAAVGFFGCLAWIGGVAPAHPALFSLSGWLLALGLAMGLVARGG